MGKNASHFHPTADVTAAPLVAGVSERVLSEDPAAGNRTVLQTYEPGWKQAAAYAHDYWEEIFVVSGRLYDHMLARWVLPGEYACRPPGQEHGPFECGPDEGASVLLVNTASWARDK